MDADRLFALVSLMKIKTKKSFSNLCVLCNVGKLVSGEECYFMLYCLGLN